MEFKSLMLPLLILLIPVMVFLAVIMLPTILATTDTVEIAVNITEACTIEVTPAALNWTGVSTGAAATVQTLDVKNTGSQNVSNIYASVDTESSRPYGLGASAYEAGAFLVMHNSTETTYYFVDRREWNLSTQPTGSTFESGAVSWGWFRNTSSEYLWSLKPGATPINASQGCNSTGTSLRISSSADTGSNRDISTATDICSGTLTTGAGYATCYSDNAPFNGLCVLINQSCDYIQVYKFDYGISPTCTNRQYLKSAVLTPESIETVSANVWIPDGVPAGDVSNSTLTITATCA